LELKDFFFVFHFKNLLYKILFTSYTVSASSQFFKYLKTYEALRFYLLNKIPKALPRDGQMVEKV